MGARGGEKQIGKEARIWDGAPAYTRGVPEDRKPRGDRDLSGRKEQPARPRANLELAEAFAEAVGRMGNGRPAQAWDLCSRLAGLSLERAVQNTPGEFVAFCGVRGEGALGTVSDKFLERAMEALREHSGDDRWRIRESVAASIQMLLVKSPEKVLRGLEGWVVADHWLEMRAVAAGVAEPALVKHTKLADGAFKLHRKVLDLVLRSDDHKSEEFKTLRQTLGYSLSVAAVAKPVESFGFMKELVESGDGDALWIVGENLEKDRLLRGFPKEAAALGGLMERGLAKRRASLSPAARATTRPRSFASCP